MRSDAHRCCTAVSNGAGRATMPISGAELVGEVVSVGSRREDVIDPAQVLDDED